MSELRGGAASIGQLLDQVEALLRSPTVAMELGRRGVNTSLALVAAQGLSAYIEGQKLRAADDLATAAEEIRARLERG